MSSTICAPARMIDGSTSIRLIRVTVFNKRKAGLTNAEVAKYWLDKHHKIAAPWLIHAGFLEYKQVRITPEDHALAASFTPSTDAVYDGYASFLVPNVETLLAAFTDPEYLSTVKPDEELFVDHSGSKLVIGYESVRIVGGKQL